jgi:hypothetical protein
MAQLIWFLPHKGCTEEVVSEITQQTFFTNKQCKVSNKKFSQSQGFILVNNGYGPDIINVATSSNARDTYLGLCVKEQR